MSRSSLPVEAVTVTDAADMLRLSVRAVQRMVANETLRSVKIGKSRRIPKSEIARLLGE